jgi:hypothetical protein
MALYHTAVVIAAGLGQLVARIGFVRGDVVIDVFTPTSPH